DIFNAVWKGLSACAVMAAVLILWLSWSVFLPAWVVTLGGLILGVVVYGGLLVILKIKEVGILWGTISKKFLNRLP
ncbi:MAG: hypothetical protein GYA12_00370, partial [Chloroflexi bacterium]|nr:hypothetical protein [Chloroflexota bacterium]